MSPDASSSTLFKRCVLPAALWLALAAPDARAADRGETRAIAPLISETSPRFGADLRASLTARGTAVGLDLEIPYSELQFIRVPGGYGAVLQVTVVFRTAKKNEQAGGDVWEDRIAVPTIGASRDPAARARFRRSFALEPGEYRVELSVEDQNGGRVSRARGTLAVPVFASGGLGLGDLEFGLCGADGRFVSVPSRRYEADLAMLCVRGAVYDRSVVAAERTVALNYEVRSETGESVAHGDTALEVNATTTFELRPRVGNLFLGQYTLAVEAKEGSRRWKTERTFEVETMSLPRGQSYATVIEILSYIATDAEYEQLRRATTDSTQQVAWEMFWGRRDPSPETPRNEALIDFFRRVRYANRTFAIQGVAGWRCDQGRIWIRYGQPDQVEERPATFYEPPMQVWQYFTLNRRYVFADREGFGRYELVYPSGER